MATPSLTPAYDYFLDFILRKATAEEILSFRLPEEARERAIELLDKQDRDALTPEELVEMEQMAQVERMIMALKAKALSASDNP